MTTRQRLIVLYGIYIVGTLLLIATVIANYPQTSKDTNLATQHAPHSTEEASTISAAVINSISTNPNQWALGFMGTDFSGYITWKKDGITIIFSEHLDHRWRLFAVYYPRDVLQDDVKVELGIDLCDDASLALSSFHKNVIESKQNATAREREKAIRDVLNQPAEQPSH